jgi:glycosyltransferase involved in cell wall biosynthesis
VGTWNPRGFEIFRQQLQRINMESTQKVTFIIPCRNNLPYLKLCLESIHKYYGNYHDIIVLDDASTDGTSDFIRDVYQPIHPNVLLLVNSSDKRMGHTYLYDVGIFKAKTEIITILHSDMVIGPKYVENMVKNYQPDTVVSATRVEPPLHPSGPEKITMNFGLDCNEFDSVGWDEYATKMLLTYDGIVTGGIFAPWMMSREVFFDVIGGHDGLFAPMELEDSDLFNRMSLAGMTFCQSRDAFVYHFTCRGSRFKDGVHNAQEIAMTDGSIWYKPQDSDEYIQLRKNKFREWHRKWKSNVYHDDFMMPVVMPRYTIAALVTNCTGDLLYEIEPWFDALVVDCDFSSYAIRETTQTMYQMSKRIYPLVEKKSVLDRFAYIAHINGNAKVDVHVLEHLHSIIDQKVNDPAFQLKTNPSTNKSVSEVIPINEWITLQITRIEPKLDMVYPEFPQIPFLQWKDDSRIQYKISNDNYLKRIFSIEEYDPLTQEIIQTNNGGESNE